MHRIVEVRRLDHVVLLVATQSMLRPEGGRDPDVAAGGERIERVGQVLRDRRRMRQQGHTPALEWRAQGGLGEEAIDAEFHGPECHGALRWREFVRKAIRVMEIRLARRMSQRPVRFAAARVLDQRRETETPAGVSRQVRQLTELERGLQSEERGARLDCDGRCADAARLAHPASVAVELIGCPLGRWRKLNS